MIDNNDKIERLKFFCEKKIYTHIKDKFDFNFNGFVININETDNSVIFEDDILNHIPILINDIAEINYSTKNKDKENDKK